MQTAGHSGCIVDIHDATAGKIGGEGDAQQPLLTAAVHPIADIHKRGLAHDAIGKFLNQPYLLNHIQSPGTVPAVGKVYRISQSGKRLDQSYVRPSGGLLRVGRAGWRSGPVGGACRGGGRRVDGRRRGSDGSRAAPVRLLRSGRSAWRACGGNDCADQYADCPESAESFDLHFLFLYQITSAAGPRKRLCGGLPRLRTATHGPSAVRIELRSVKASPHGRTTTRGKRSNPTSRNACQSSLEGVAIWS